MAVDAIAAARTAALADPESERFEKTLEEIEQRAQPRVASEQARAYSFIAMRQSSLPLWLQPRTLTMSSHLTSGKAGMAGGLCSDWLNTSAVTIKSTPKIPTDSSSIAAPHAWRLRLMHMRNSSRTVKLR